MHHARLTRRTQAAAVVGWISNNDALLVGLILTLAITFYVSASLQRSQAKTRQMQSHIEGIKTQLRQAEVLFADAENRRGHLNEENRRLAAAAAQFASARNRLQMVQGELGQIRAHFKQVEAEQSRLIEENRRLDRVTAQVAPLRTETEELKASLAAAEEQRRRSADENHSLKSKLAAAAIAAADKQKLLEQMTDGKRDVKAQLIALAQDRDRALRESQLLRGWIEAEPGLHKELLGLRGELRRVAILFDTSGSMGQGERWEQARGVVARWLEHLAISECVLILFSNDVRVLPEDGSLLDMRGPNGPANRRLLLERIAATKPQGGTNTLAALQSAYRCPNVDTIILFTDGEPNDPARFMANRQFDPEVAEKIYALCSQHKGIPINTIGVADYFKPQLSGFLMRVAQETGGSFMGR